MLEPAKAAGLPLALGLIDRSPLFLLIFLYCFCHSDVVRAISATKKDASDDL